MIGSETYLDLLSDPAHWAFELTLMLLFDGLLLGLAWPLVKRAVRRHDERHHPDDVSQEERP